ncbi:MAG: cyclase family protein [Bacteroidota bacterium]
MLPATQQRVIDLSLPYDEAIAGYQASPARKIAQDGWNAQTLQIYSHAGTHMDAPLHFGLEGTMDEYDPAGFMGKAWVVSLEVHSPRRLITVADLGEVAVQFETGDSLLIRTGWSQTLGEARYRDELPHISEELAYWMADHKVNMLGVEPPSVADVNDLPELTRIHQILLGAGIKIIEGLCRLEEIQSASVCLIALPLNIKGGDGAPCRVLAIENAKDA